MAHDPSAALRQFLDVLPRVANGNDLASATAAASTPFGLPTVMAGAILIRGDKIDAHFYFGNWPSEWRALYPEQVLADDPLVAQARRRVTPFTWSEIKAEPDLPAAVRQAFEITHAHGWRDGLAVPIHGPGGYVALVSFAGGDITLDACDRAILQMIAHAAHQRSRELYRNRPGQPARELSPREAQVMRWVASGKTDWEIGQILDISETTAHFHVEQAKRKLGVRSRTQAVGALILDGRL